MMLVQCFEKYVRNAGCKQIAGPCWRAAAFYGGYILGNEPYHPHWATDATNAYLRSGFGVSHQALLLRNLLEKVTLDPVHDMYELVEVSPSPEVDAVTFGYHAMYNSEKAAHCYARWYPNLLSPGGGMTGQIGHVTTDSAHRSKGLARTMVQRSLERMKEAGVSDVLIATGLANIPALKCYERAGFQRCSYIMEWSKEPDDVSTPGRCRGT